MNGLILSISQADERLLRAFVARRRAFGDVFMRVVTKLGNPVVVIPLTLALAWSPGPVVGEAGDVAAWSLSLSHLVVQLLKRSVSRPRPSLPVGMGSLIEPEDRFSFPSGHAAAGLSVGLPLFLMLAGPLAGLALVLGLLVGVSRCYLGVHYPCDVLVGWALAAVTVAGVLLLS